MLKLSLRFVAALCGVFLGFVLLVEALAYLSWQMSGFAEVSLLKLEKLEKLTAPNRNPIEAKKLHSIAEWPECRGRNFQEAPSLLRRVEAGELPPVAQRLPENPLVIIPPEQIGPYGGTWVRFGTSPDDISVYEGRLAYEGLVRWGPMGRKVLPNLAVRWEITDGGRTYTFWLRKGVRWSDGKPFTADDIMFWYEDVVKNSELTPMIGRTWVRGGELFQLEKLDDYTVRYKFKEPHGLFLKKLAEGSYWAIFPAHYLKQFHPKYVPKERLEQMAREKSFDLWYQLFWEKRSYLNPEIPRLWPWVMTQPPPARPVVFERNPYYWKVDPEGNQLPYIDRVTYGIYSPETINLKAINGEIGMQARHMDFRNYPLFMSNRGKGGYRILHWISGGGGTLQLGLNLNHKDPVLKKIFHDRRFRIALSHAINRDEINEAKFFGIGTPRQLCPPRASPYYCPEYERAYIEYDPQLANRLLDEMGLDKKNADGIRLRPDGKPLTLHIETTSILGIMGDAELIADYWTAVGVKTQIKEEARQLLCLRKDALVYDVGVWQAADELMPLMDPRYFFPYNPGSIQGIDYARWWRSKGKAGEKPTPEMLRCIELYEEIQRTPEANEAKQIRLFKKIIDLNLQNLWVIGTIGEVPTIVLVSNAFRNVPEVAVYGWLFRSPGNTAPECYSIEEN